MLYIRRIKMNTVTITSLDLSIKLDQVCNCFQTHSFNKLWPIASQNLVNIDIHFQIENWIFQIASIFLKGMSATEITLQYSWQTKQYPYIYENLARTLNLN